MGLEAPNYQFPTGIAPLAGDRGTVALIIGPDGKYSALDLSLLLSLLEDVLAELQSIRAALPAALAADGRFKVTLAP